MNYDSNKDAFTAGLEAAEELGEAMAELLEALMLLFAFVMEEVEIKKQEDRKKEIYKNLERVQAALNSGQSPAKALQLLTINLYEVSDLLKQTRAIKQQPELSFKDRLTAHRKTKEEQIEQAERILNRKPSIEHMKKLTNKIDEENDAAELKPKRRLRL